MRVMSPPRSFPRKRESMTKSLATRSSNSGHGSPPPDCAGACFAGTTKSLQLDGLEVGRQHDLQHLAVVRIVEHPVTDARWLQPAAPSPHDMRAGALELGLDPALEDIDHLQVDVVEMQLGDLPRIAWRHEANDVRLHHAVCGLGHAEIAVGRVAPQTDGKILV